MRTPTRERNTLLCPFCDSVLDYSIGDPTSLSVGMREEIVSCKKCGASGYLDGMKEEEDDQIL